MTSSASTSADSSVSHKLSNSKGNPHFERLVRVQEQDVDRMGLAVAAMYPRWMEETEYGFLRSRGLSVSMTDERGRYGFPRTHVEWEISSAARHEDELRVRLWLGKTDGKSLEYQFQIDRRDSLLKTAEPNNWEPCCTGQFAMCCCRFPPEAMPYAIPIPDATLQRLGLEPE